MPDDLLLSDGSHMRQADTAYVLDCVENASCCAVVAISNMGKSALLRLLAHPSLHRGEGAGAAATDTFVLVDCNRMLELSEQGFYELVLRCAQEHLGGEEDGALRQAYDRLIHPTSPFDIPLSFNQGMTAIGSRPDRRLVLLFDEFDEALAGIQGRVFLNLRALKDQYKHTLVYITATNQALRQLRDEPTVGEFTELFTNRTHYLPPLNETDVRLYAQRFARREGITFDRADERFIQEWSGGHPGLLEATCRALGRVTGPAERDESQDRVIHREVASWLSDELGVRVECRRIWEQLSDGEQEALLGFTTAGESPAHEAVAGLRQKHVLRGAADQPVFFARLFAEHVQRLRATKRPQPRGIRVDVESGIVYVDGQETPTLTKLEYRLLLLLYGRINQIVDKYDVVEAVWGEDYIDEVDDARIEKLVSRLRSKVEPDAHNPRHVITVRGRGYRLEG